MSKIIIFAGTTEGRELAQLISSNNRCADVCVASEYGKMIMNEMPGICVIQGRKDSEQMLELFNANSYDCAIDATHPYATEVSKNIRSACEKAGLQYIRLLRDGCGKKFISDYDKSLGVGCEKNFSSVSGKTFCEDKKVEGGKIFIDRNVLIEDELNNNFENVVYTDSIESCINALKDTEGNILLTTGSKNLPYFTADNSLKERLYVRVIPGLESLEICQNNGVFGERVIAMQGPFSEELNIAIIKQFNIKVLVTKQSGVNGGFFQKINACQKTGIKCFVIGNSDISQIEDAKSFEQVCEFLGLKKVSDNKIVTDNKMDCNNEISITIAGIGMGNVDGMTCATKRHIQEAQVIFGSKRMIEKAKGICNTDNLYTLYRPEDICEIIDNFRNKEFNLKECSSFLILMSGDTGFYSGAGKVFDFVKKRYSDADVYILPGISSISSLSALTGVSWQDAGIISLHGREDKISLAKSVDSVRYNNKTFILFSGISQLCIFVEKLYNYRLGKCDGYIAFDMGEADSKILEMSIHNLYHMLRDESFIKEWGEVSPLITALFINNNPIENIITPHMRDDTFLREVGKKLIPMTKEEIRWLSLCKLGISKNSVVYDIGSGTGSIAVEIATLDSSVSVYGIECKKQAYELLQKNVEKNGLENITIIYGEAPDALEKLETPTHVFIGGSNGKLLDIICELKNKIKVEKNYKGCVENCDNYYRESHDENCGKYCDEKCNSYCYDKCHEIYESNSIRVVITAVTMETKAEILNLAKASEIFNEEIIEVMISKSHKAGEYHLMKAENPIMIASFEIR